MPKTEENDWDYSYKKSPVCPHCDHVHDMDDMWNLYSDDDTHEVNCPNCQKTYLVDTHIECTFSTSYEED